MPKKPPTKPPKENKTKKKFTGKEIAKGWEKAIMLEALRREGLMTKASESLGLPKRAIQISSYSDSLFRESLDHVLSELNLHKKFSDDWKKTIILEAVKRNNDTLEETSKSLDLYDGAISSLARRDPLFRESLDHVLSELNLHKKFSDDWKKTIILEAVKRNNGDLVKATKSLGLSESEIYGLLYRDPTFKKYLPKFTSSLYKKISDFSHSELLDAVKKHKGNMSNASLSLGLHIAAIFTLSRHNSSFKKALDKIISDFKRKRTRDYTHSELLDAVKREGTASEASRSLGLNRSSIAILASRNSKFRESLDQVLSEINKSKDFSDSWKQAIILEAVKQNNGVLKNAAESLGMNINTVYNLIKKDPSFKKALNQIRDEISLSELFENSGEDKTSVDQKIIAGLGYNYRNRSREFNETIRTRLPQLWAFREGHSLIKEGVITPQDIIVTMLHPAYQGQMYKLIHKDVRHVMAQDLERPYFQRAIRGKKINILGTINWLEGKNLHNFLLAIGRCYPKEVNITFSSNQKLSAGFSEFMQKYGLKPTRVGTLFVEPPKSIDPKQASKMSTLRKIVTLISAPQKGSKLVLNSLFTNYTKKEASKEERKYKGTTYSENDLKRSSNGIIWSDYISDEVIIPDITSFEVYGQDALVSFSDGSVLGIGTNPKRDIVELEGMSQGVLEGITQTLSGNILDLSGNYKKLLSIISEKKIKTKLIRK